MPPTPAKKPARKAGPGPGARRYRSPNPPPSKRTTAKKAAPVPVPTSPADEVAERLAAASTKDSVRAAFGELKFSVEIDPPDSPTPGIPVRLDVDLANFTLEERQLAKRAMAKMTAPDMEEVIVVHAWVVWRRSWPNSSLTVWFKDIRWSDVVMGLAIEPGHVNWDTTPEDVDPEK